MTLCALWRRGQQIQVATDSRLNWNVSRADVGVKLMALPLHLYDPVPQGEPGPPRLAHSRILGLATVGSLETTYIAKELLETVLSSLQFAPGLTDISMEGIANVCARILRNVSREVCAVLAKDGQGQLVLVGRCLETDRSRVFLLTVVAPMTGVDVTVEEILTENGSRYLGSGAAAAEKWSLETGEIFPYQLVRRVANDPDVPSVGGNVQFGVLDTPDFRITGIRDYTVNHARKEFYVGWYLGGLEILGDGERALLGDTGFHFSRAFLNPFEGDIAALLHRGYRIVPSASHWELELTD